MRGAGSSLGVWKCPCPCPWQGWDGMNFEVKNIPVFHDSVPEQMNAVLKTLWVFFLNFGFDTLNTRPFDTWDSQGCFPCCCAEHNQEK